jgi:hypothetical protein
LTLTSAARTRDLEGSRPYFFRYNHAPKGLYAALVRAIRRDAEGYPLDEIWWMNPGETDSQGYIDLHMRRIPTYFRFRQLTSEFYGDPRKLNFALSRRSQSDFRLHLQKTESLPILDFWVRDQDLSNPSIGRFLPFRGVDYNATELGMRASLPLLGGRLTFEPRHVEVDDQSGLLPDRDTTWLSAELAHPVTNRADLSAAVDHAFTKSAGMDTASWTILRAQANVRPFSLLSVNGFYRQQRVHLPDTVTDYADRRDLAGVDFGANPLRGLSLYGGLFHEGMRRRDRDSGRVEEPSWTGNWLQLRATPSDRWLFSARFRSRSLNDAPNTGIPVLADTRTLYYTREQNADARLDVFLTNRLSAYLMYGWNRRDNGQRATRLSLQSGTLGLSAQLHRRLSATVEVSQQRWRGNIEPFLAGPGLIPGLPPAGPSPSLFFSDGRVLSGDFTYELDGRSSLGLSLNRLTSTGGQSARDTMAVLEYRRDAGKNLFFSIGYQYERFRDRSARGRLGRGFTAFPLLLQVGYHREFR